MAETLGLSGVVISFIQLVILLGLQIFLCRCKNKWLGLILPAFYLGKSVYMLTRTLTMGLLAEYGLLGQIIFAFVLPNITTVVLLLIYYFNRNNKPVER